MTESVKKRRRWPWLVLASVLLMVVGGFPFTSRYRPLSHTERRLVGVWTTPLPQTDAIADTTSTLHYYFNADRTYVIVIESRLPPPADSTRVVRQADAQGRWSCSESAVTLIPKESETDWSTPESHLYELLFGNPERETLSLQFDADGTLQLEGVPLTPGRN